MVMSNDRIFNSVKLQHFYVEDLWGRIKHWPHLVGTKMTSGVKLQNRVKGLSISTNALEFDLETSKKFEICPFHINMKFNRPLLVIANIPLIMETSRTLSVALQNEKLDFNYFIQMALNHIMILRNKT